MESTIVVVGATGNLGMRLAKALRGREANVVALVRTQTRSEKVNLLEALGAKVVAVDLGSAPEIANAMRGRLCSFCCCRVAECDCRCAVRPA